MTNTNPAAANHNNIAPGCLVKLAERKAPLLVVAKSGDGWTLQGARKDFHLSFTVDGRALIIPTRGMYYPRETRVEAIIP
jgi:hypothetical protein